MFLLSDHSREQSDPAGIQIGADIHSIYSRLPTVDSSSPFAAAHHFTFSDQALLKSQYMMRVISSLAGVGKLEARRGLTITTTFIHTFFDAYLKGAPSSALTGVSSQYPEVQFRSATGSLIVSMRRDYPNTSRTLRVRFCNVKGFCRKNFPLSIVPSLTMASSVYPER